MAPSLSSKRKPTDRKNPGPPDPSVDIIDLLSDNDDDDDVLTVPTQVSIAAKAVALNMNTTGTVVKAERLSTSITTSRGEAKNKNSPSSSCKKKNHHEGESTARTTATSRGAAFVISAKPRAREMPIASSSSSVGDSQSASKKARGETTTDTVSFSSSSSCCDSGIPQNLKNPPPSTAQVPAKLATNHKTSSTNISSGGNTKSSGVAATVATTLTAGFSSITAAIKNMASSHNTSSSTTSREQVDKTSALRVLEPDVDDDNNDNGDEESCWPRCVAALHQQCWSPHCQVPLNQGFYAMHAHPLFSVPMCSVCAEEVEAVEQARIAKQDGKATSNNNNKKKDDDDDDEEKEDFCAGCAIGESSGELFFLCDNNHHHHVGKEENNELCGRAFCQSCLAQAFGGGVPGWKQTKQLAAAPEEDVWKCLVCQPTAALTTLSQITMQPSSQQQPQEKASNNGSPTAAAAADQQEQQRGTAAEVFDKILGIEAERRETIDLLDDESKKWDEIRQELRLEGITNETDLEEAALEELEEWKDQLLKHDRRLVDLLTTLQDDFQHGFGMDLAYAYEQAGLLPTKSDKEDADSGGDEDDDPDWVRRANRAIQKRPRKQESPLVYKANDNQEEIDGYMDVEVLADLEQGESTVLAKGFEAFQGKVIITDERWAELEQEERAYLELKKIQPRIHEPKTELDDVEETRHEEKEQSCPGTNGVARIVTRTLQPRRRNRQGTKAADQEHPKTTTPIETEGKKPALVPPGQEAAETASTAAVGTPSGGFKSSHRTDAPWSSSSSRKMAATPNKKTGSISNDCTPASQRKLRGVTSSNLQLCKKGGVFKCSVAVDPQLAEQLKAHQREGVEFMFNNSFVDLVQKDGNKSETRGSILAHHMGLGKSLTSITLIHTLWAHDLVKTVMLVVPVNTITNWKDEFSTWTQQVRSPCLVYDISEVQPFARDNLLNNWKRFGGVLIISPGTLVSHMKDMNKCSDGLIECDTVVIDEGHLCLKSSTTMQAKKLHEIKTKRRIVLTGTPLSNNLLEYYNVASFVQPGCLDTEVKFVREFKDPIEMGMASDSSPSASLRSQQKSAELHRKLEAIVHRKDASVLRQVLPPLQQVVLHVRPTRIQSNIYNDYKRFQRKVDSKNFFKAFQALRPINNHPGCIVVRANEDMDRENSAKKKSSNSEDTDEKDDDPDNKQFHDSIRQNKSDDVLLSVDSGSKFVLLLHVLAQAARQNEKVLIFSNCLRTLSFVERVLGYPDWKEHVPSLAASFPDALGGWEKGKDFYRIDGYISGSDRGDIVKKFNNDSSRTLLLSMQAGGIGTNLTAATRVVLLDTHFNPSVLEQAIARCHRFGQDKPVFAYRLLTVGSVEEKVYARTVTKSGVASRVVDNKTMERFFTAREISDLQTTNLWAQCDHCEKWRMMLGDVEREDLPQQWFCEMNTDDPDNNTCAAEERDEAWYANRLDSAQRLDAAQVLASLVDMSSAQPVNDCNSADSSLSKEDTQRLVDRDPILKHLLKITENKKKSTIVSRHYFHEALMQIQDNEEEPELVPNDSKVAETSKIAIGSKSKKRAPLENISSKASKHPRSESPKKSKGAEEDDSVALNRAEDSHASVAPDSSNGKKRARSLPPSGREQSKHKTSTTTETTAGNPDDIAHHDTTAKRNLFHGKSKNDSVPTSSPSSRKNPTRAARSPSSEPTAAAAAAAAAPSRRSNSTRTTSPATKQVKKESNFGGKGGKENAIDITTKKPPPCEKQPEIIDLADSDDDEASSAPYNYEMTV